MTLAFQPDPESGFTQAVGVGGIGTGVAFQLEGDQTLGREESRLGALLPGRDYCKLHIVEHYLATLMGSKVAGSQFPVVAIGVVGEDPAGHQLLREMSEAGIDTQWVRKDPDRATLFSTCFVYPNAEGGNITASNSAAATLEERDLGRGAEWMKGSARQCIALCLPEVSLDIRHKFLKLATECGNFRVASFTRAEIAPAQALDLFSSVDLLAINQEEASALVGYAYTHGNTEKFFDRCSAVLTAVQPAIRIIVSAGSNGAYGFENGKWSYCSAPRVPVASTAGAGDALLAGVLSGLAAGLPFTRSQDVPHATPESEINSALGLGVLLASFSVTSPDTIHFQANVGRLEAFASSLGISLGSGVRQAFCEA